MTTKNAHILAFVGMPGSGKSTAVDYLAEKGYPKVYVGGILYQAMKDEGIEITWESQNKFREEIRKREGQDFLIKRAIVQLQHLIDAGQHHIIFDGLYSWSEYKILKHAFPGEVSIVGVVVPRRIRKHRLSQRPERPMTSTEVDERDYSEIEQLQKGGPIAMADHFIINDGTTEQFYEQIETELTRIHFK